MHVIPRHSLNKAFTEMVKSNGDLHILVLSIRITMPQEHNLIMMCHIIIGYRHCGGPHDGINQAISAV